MYFPGAMATLHVTRHSLGRDSALGHGITSCTDFRTVMSLPLSSEGGPNFGPGHYPKKSWHVGREPISEGRV